MDALPNSKLVDMCNKLVSGNTTVQYQNVAKIYQYLLQNSENERKKALHKIIESLHLIKSKNCYYLLLKMLVKCCIEELIDFNSFMNCLLSLINSKDENSIYCIDTITSLLVLYPEYCTKLYTIRNPTHPFIEILRNSNDLTDNYHELIYQQIEYIYDHSGLGLKLATELLKPVFVEVFLEKSSCKHLIASFLIKKIALNKSKSVDLIIDLVYLYFKCLKNSDLSNILFRQPFNDLLSICTNLNDYVDENNVKNKKLNEIFNLIFFAKLLLKIDQIFSFSLINQWKCMKILIKKELVNEELIHILAENLCLVAFKNLESYLEFIIQVLDSYENIKSVELAIFFPNILSYSMSFGALDKLSGEISSHLRFLITTLVTKIETHLKKSDKLDSVVMNDSSLFNLMDYEEVYSFTKDPNEKINQTKFNLLSAYFILNENDVDLNKKIYDLFRTILIKWPHLHVTVFSLYMYKIKNSTNHKIVNFCLKHLVDLSVASKADIGLCLNFFVSLMNQNDQFGSIYVKLTCVEQLTKLCANNYDHLVFPYLSNELIAIKDLNLPESIRLEILYMKADCIKKIIEHRPDYYANELLATISHLLNKCNLPNDEGICAILVDALAILCESQVVDMQSTYKALLPLFKKESRVLAMSSYCRFMSVVSKLDHLNNPDSSDNFFDSIINVLWSLCKLNAHDTSSAKITNAALKALSSFKKTNFRCSQFPMSIQENLKQRNMSLFSLEENKEKSIDDLFKLVPSVCYLDLFKLISQESYEGLNELFKTSLIEEINNMPRRSISQAGEKIYSKDDQKQTQKNVNDTINKFLVEEYSAFLKETTTNLDGLVLLNSYDPPIERNKEGQIFKRHTVNNWVNYEKTLRILLANAVFEIDEENINLFSNGFKRFFQNAYNGCVNSFRFQYESLLDEKNKQNSEIKKNIANSWIEAREKLTEILIESFQKRLSKNTESIGELSNIYLLALAGLISASTSHALNDSANTSNDEMSKPCYNQRKWLESLVDFILNIEENKTANEAEYITSFNYNQYHSVETLKFLFKLYKNTKIINYILATIHPLTIQIKISDYLIKYIFNRSADLIANRNDLNGFDLLSIGLHVKNLIQSSPSAEFNFEKNNKINNYIESLYNLYISSMNKAQKSIVLMTILTDCLNKLYDEESIYYDEKYILESYIKDINTRLIEKKYPFDEMSKETKINMSATSSLLNLTCIAYKCNLIKNDFLLTVYEYLNSDSKYSSSLAFYVRFLIIFGYYGAIKWLESSYSNWTGYLNDFKLNIEPDAVKADNVAQSLLTLLTGVSIEASIIINQPFSLSSDIEKFLKIEKTVTDLMKFFANSNDYNKQKLLLNLSLSVFKHNESTYEEIYTTPNSYDYLDEQSLLKLVVNELSEISKICNLPIDDSKKVIQMKFEFLVKLILASCQSSKVKTLPPINWYYVVNSWIKSEFGKNVECELVQLTILQINSSNSAFRLIKNYLIDTNYFDCLSPSTQLLVFNSLNVICNRLNLALLKKFLEKMKIYLKKNYENKELNFAQFSSILTSLYSYFNDLNNQDKEKQNEKNAYKKEMISFFHFIASSFTYDLIKPDHRKLLHLIADNLIKCDENSIEDSLIDLNEVVPIESIFLTKFYIRTQILKRQRENFFVLNVPIDLAIEHRNLINDETKNIFLLIFGDCMLQLNSLQYKFSLDEATISKSNGMMNVSLNWLMELIGMIREINNQQDLENEKVEFGLELFVVFIYAWSHQSPDLNYPNENNDLAVIDFDFVYKNFNFYLNKFLKQSHWKQLKKKLIEWLITIQSGRNFSLKFNNILKDSLIELYQNAELSNETWIKFANLTNQKLNSLNKKD